MNNWQDLYSDIKTVTAIHSKAKMSYLLVLKYIFHYWHNEGGDAKLIEYQATKDSSFVKSFIAKYVSISFAHMHAYKILGRNNFRTPW